MSYTDVIDCGGDYILLVPLMPRKTLNPVGENRIGSEDEIGRCILLM